MTIMIKLLFFAKYRELLNFAELDMELPSSVTTVAELKKNLSNQYSDNDNWQQVLNDENLVVAVNQQVVKSHHPINDGDEIAFFPPVTGG